MVNLGDKVEDVVTGFKGIAYGKANYLTGCTTVLVLPQGLTSDGKKLDGEWFDEDRLEVIVAGEIKIKINNDGGINDYGAPKK